jgi:hypothetical protein
VILLLNQAFFSLHHSDLEKQYIQGVAKLTYSSRGSCREKSQESRKNKIKNIGGESLQIYMGYIFFKVKANFFF